MKTAFETTRLQLRPLEITDAEDLFKLDSDPVVCQYLGTEPVASVDKSEEIIRMIRKQYDDHGIGRLAMVLKETGHVIGWCGLKWHTEEVNGTSDFYDLGFRLLPQYWGQGIATEAARAVIEEAFIGMPIDKIYAYADTRNKASIRVLEKLGFHYVKLFYDKEELCSWYELSREDYSANR